MADANVIICNAAGIEVVSFGGKSLHCRQKVVLPSSGFTKLNGPNGKSSWTCALSVAGKTNPLVAIATDTAGQAGAGVYLNGAVYVGSDASATPPNAIAYVLDWGYPKGSTNYGCELYDPVTGAIVFTTADPPVRIVGPVQCAGYFPSPTPPASIAPPAGRTYAALMLANYRLRQVGAYNSGTGDIIANDFMNSAGGGMAGVACGAGGTSGGGYQAYIGSLALPHGSPGPTVPGASMGGIGGVGSCLVLDVTGI